MNGSLLPPRVQMGIELFAARQLLSLHFAEAKDIAASNLVDTTGMGVQLRAYLLPNDDPNAVATSLFRLSAVSQSTAFKKRSVVHMGSACPAFDEVFRFDISLLASQPNDFALFVAIVTTRPVSNNPTTYGNHVLGCFAMSLRDVLSRANHDPQWYRLLKPEQGLKHFDSLPESPAPLNSVYPVQPAAQMAGRLASLANSNVNGIYDWQPESLHGRPVFHQTKHDLFLYFFARREAWVISERLGSDSPIAYAIDPAMHPGSICAPWHVFSLERSLSTPMQKQLASYNPAARAAFELDTRLHCIAPEFSGSVLAAAMANWSFNGAASLSPTTTSTMYPLGTPASLHSPTPGGAQSAMPTPGSAMNRLAATSVSHLSLNGGAEHPGAATLTRRHTVSVNERRKALQALSASHSQFTRSLAFVANCKAALHAELSPMQTTAIFRNSDAVLSVCQEAQALMDRASGTDSSNQDLGVLLKHMENKLREPLLVLCSSQESAIPALKSALSVDSGLAIHLQELERQHGLFLQNALADARRQAEAYPTLLATLVEATASTAVDYSILSEVQTKFASLLQEACSNANHRVFKTRAPSQLLDNFIAYDGAEPAVTAAPSTNMIASGLSSPSLSSAPYSAAASRPSSPPPEPDMEEDLSRPGSAYSTLIRGPPKRMTMVPDLELDEDELPVAEHENSRASLPASSSVPQLQTVTEEEDESVPAKPMQTTLGTRPVVANPWLHHDIEKEQATSLIMGKEPVDGRFLVRRSSSESAPGFVLSLIYKGKPTHHLIQQNEEGDFTVNRRVFGQPPPRTLEDTIRALAADPPAPSWPQRLTEFVAVPGCTAADITAAKAFLGYA